MSSSNGIQKTDPMIRLVQIFSAKLVLEVFGGAGAIWGFSEALTLRTPDTIWFWRPCALFFGFVFFIRWTKQIQDYLDEVYSGKSVERLNAMVRLVQIFSAKLVLEVFGGAGAIWGFSEAVTLRNPDTVWFWRPCALTFGVIFFVRWLMQIQDYLVEVKYNETVDRLAAKAGETEELCCTTSDEELSENGLSYNSIRAA